MASGTLSPTRVLLVTPSLSSLGGGLAEAVRQQALALAEHPGFAVAIVTTRDAGLAGENLAAVPVSAFACFGPANFRFSPGLLLHLLGCKPDLVHLHGLWNFQCLAVLLWSLFRGGRYVVSPHGMLEPWILSRSKPLKWLVGRMYQNALLRRATAFHALTSAEAEQIRLLVPHAVCRVIPNFVVPASPTNDAPSWWRPDYSGRTVFLFLGRIHAKKGWRELCDAWTQLCQGDPEIARQTLLVVGGWTDGAADFSEVTARANARCGNIVTPGPQFGPDKAATLARASFFVLPSRSEGLPLGVLEAWAAGVPAIISAGCRLPEGFTAGAALKTGAGAPSILQALRRGLALDAADRDRMARAARMLVAKSFSKASVLTELAALYHWTRARARP